jgi:hypothetical protein
VKAAELALRAGDLAVRVAADEGSVAEAQSGGHAVKEQRDPRGIAL